MEYQGIAAASGYALGTAFLLQERFLDYLRLTNDKVEGYNHKLAKLFRAA